MYIGNLLVCVKVQISFKFSKFGSAVQGLVGLKRPFNTHFGSGYYADFQGSLSQSSGELQTSLNMLQNTEGSDLVVDLMCVVKCAALV